MTIPVTVVVLTKNEEVNIRKCLGSLITRFSDIHILDSGSTDNTCQIACELGAQVHTNHFQGFGAQRNWAIDHIRHLNDWVLHLDADECVTEEFCDELNAIANQIPEMGGYYVPSKLMLNDQWLRYSSGYPVYQVRVFHRERLRFENYGHGQRELTTYPLAYMKQPYIHNAFSKGLESWLVKHVQYALSEAEQVLSEQNSIRQLVRDLAKGDRVGRRRALKQLSFLLPGRSFLRFAHALVLKRGILDGHAGVTYAKMLAAYESLFVAAVAARRSGWK